MHQEKLPDMMQESSTTSSEFHSVNEMTDSSLPNFVKDDKNSAMTVDITDNDVRLAAEALGVLRSGDGRSSCSSPVLSPGDIAPAAEGDEYYSQSMDIDDLNNDTQNNKDHFMTRVSNIPLVRSHISTFTTAYSATKNTSRVLKYSAESVESGISSITRPVLNKLDPILRPMDRFACNQLDRLESRFPTLKSDGTAYDQDKKLENENSVDIKSNDGSNQESRWSSMVTGVTSSVKSIVSKNDEMSKAINYCIDWLSYTSGRINYTVESLKQRVEEIRKEDNDQDKTESDHVAYLAEVKTELVNILRQMVDIIGRTAATYLPQDGRLAVKSFIMDLPAKCQSAPASTAEEETERVLVLAEEAGQAVEGVGRIFSNVDSASN